MYICHCVSFKTNAFFGKTRARPWPCRMCVQKVHGSWDGMG